MKRAGEDSSGTGLWHPVPHSTQTPVQPCIFSLIWKHFSSAVNQSKEVCCHLSTSRSLLLKSVSFFLWNTLMWKAPVMCALLIWHEYPMRAAISGNCLWCKCCFNSFNAVNYSFSVSGGPVKWMEAVAAVALSLLTLFTAVRFIWAQHKRAGCERTERTGELCIQITLPPFPPSTTTSPFYSSLPLCPSPPAPAFFFSISLSPSLLGASFFLLFSFLLHLISPSLSPPALIFCLSPVFSHHSLLFHLHFLSLLLIPLLFIHFSLLRLDRSLFILLPSCFLLHFLLLFSSLISISSFIL